MEWPPEVRIALQALARNKLTSGLTMLGICFGVAAYVCSVSIGRGASSQIEEQIRNLGENMIWVEAGSRSVNGARTGDHGARSLTVGDMQAIRRQVAVVARVSPNVDGHAQMKRANRNWNSHVRGVSPDYLSIRLLGIEKGSMFSEEDVRRAANVCVIGRTVATQLFGEDDPLGQVILIRRFPFQVGGILVAKGQTPSGQDQDDIVLMPYTTVQKKFTAMEWLDDIMCSAVSPAAIPAAEEEISALLRERHHLREGEENDFNLRHPTALLQAGAESRRAMTLLLASIASVALVVGGIGIMNIMLASVTDRTREIGIRRAVGARRRDILVQFLVEAVTLSLIGGAIGIALGVIGANCIALAVRWRTVIELSAVLVAVGFSGAVGIVFGAYPALLATRLDPVEALGR